MSLFFGAMSLKSPSPPPATIAAGDHWFSGPMPGGSISVTATLSQAGAIDIQRFADQALQMPIGPIVTDVLAAGVPGYATVNDGIVAMFFEVTIHNTSAAVGTLSEVSFTIGPF
jgi:hypothetical protein